MPRTHIKYKHITRILPFLLLLFSVLAVYGHILDYPFVADDWDALNYYSHHGTLDSLEQFFRYQEMVSYRPIGYLYTFILYNLFGLNPVPFNVSILLFHFANGILLAYIIQTILKERLFSWLAAVLYVTSVNVHIYPLIWSSTGFFDFGGMFFFLCSFLSFLKTRYKLSALAFLLALFTKPPMGILPFVLLSYVIFVPHARDKIRRMWPHFLIALTYALTLLFNVTYLPLPPTSFHRLDLFGLHIFENLFYFLSLCIPLLFPFKETGFIYLFLVSFLILLKLKKRSAVVDHATHKTGFWIAWFILGLLPPCFLIDIGLLPSYYIGYAWPAFTVLFLLFIRKAAFRFGFGRKQAAIIMTVTVIFSSLSSALYSFHENRKGIDSREEMIASAYTIRAIHDKLLEAYPSLPKGAVLIFKGRNVYWIFCERNLAPRTWYGDDSLEVCESKDLYITPDYIYIKRGKDDGYTWHEDMGDVRLSHDRPFFLVRWEGFEDHSEVHVRRLSLQEVYELSDYNKTTPAQVR